MTAGLMHDLGHPPFGHNGEKALDDKMSSYGGFEGNAQTLRIVTRLEKKISGQGAEKLTGFHGPKDLRLGLGLAPRTIASIIKYDHRIPHVREQGADLVKGYYADDAEVVMRVKDAVAPGRDSSLEFKTIECMVMDIADDIAYSTYDLEDSLKAGFLTPIEILASDEDLLDRVARKVTKELKSPVERTEVLATLWDIFSVMPQHMTPEGPVEETYNAVELYRASRHLSGCGYHRTELTSELVGEFINAVELEYDEEFPSQSRAMLRADARLKVEVLKNYTYEATIFSSRLKVAEFRGYEVVSEIFDALSKTKGYLLMPDDVRILHERVECNATARMRLICDFVAGMTDRYAVEFYGRLHSDAQSMFKPI